uniref:AlNc14C327G10652 protein n=1 Tax=Albugo laibachii Nc14 TaxID=890382 RepID=F0WWN9_9STRA|nr:AlNc14C327G10652 [Albugo laibachii Nc14]|eukprot:CCA25864.1 AlNc14C327G10652 [Albugo laibachii Nc14]
MAVAERLHKARPLFFRVKTHARQTAPADALNQAAAFVNEVARRVDVEVIKTIYNADQAAVIFELLPRTTITKTSSKRVWVKCGKKEKERMTAMVLGDFHGEVLKNPMFLVMKSAPSKIVAVDAETSACGMALGGAYGPDRASSRGARHSISWKPKRLVDWRVDGRVSTLPFWAT